MVEQAGRGPEVGLGATESHAKLVGDKEEAMMAQETVQRKRCRRQDFSHLFVTLSTRKSQ